MHRRASHNQNKVKVMLSQNEQFQVVNPLLSFDVVSPLAVN